MRIDGEWLECDEGVFRPVIRGDVLRADINWEPTLFLVDTGADCTVFSSMIFDLLGFRAELSDDRIGGVGGVVESMYVSTKIRMPHDARGIAVFRGRYAGFTQPEALDMSVLGRDFLDMFAVIIDRPNDVVALLRRGHQYSIRQG